jgi:hypothetical protein
MLNQQVNQYTLIPLTSILHANLCMDASSKLPIIVMAYIMFAILSFLYGIINVFISLSNGDSYFASFILVVCDFSRIAYYTFILISGKRNLLILIYGTYIFPCFFSIIITEVLIYVDDPSKAVVRYFFFFKDTIESFQ